MAFVFIHKWLHVAVCGYRWQHATVVYNALGVTQTPMSALFFHYTNIAGVLGILQSRSIWLTDCRFLNDRDELSRSLEDFSRRFENKRRQAFDWALWWYQLSAHQCILSLSKTPEILSQWRAYADDGRGMALGFNSSFLSRAGIKVIECVYERHVDYISEIADRHAHAIDQIEEAHSRCARIHAETRQKMHFREWVFSNHDLFTPIVQDLIALKNPAFVEEREVRLFKSVPRGDALIRQSGSLLVPYTSISFQEDSDALEYEDLAISQIWLGPKCNDLNWKALHSMDIGPCTIHKYDCGYK